jgi:hypothetical protein
MKSALVPRNGPCPPYQHREHQGCHEGDARVEEDAEHDGGERRRHQLGALWGEARDQRRARHGERHGSRERAERPERLVHGGPEQGQRHPQGEDEHQVVEHGARGAGGAHGGLPGREPTGVPDVAERAQLLELLAPHHLACADDLLPRAHLEARGRHGGHRVRAAPRGRGTVGHERRDEARADEFGEQGDRSGAPGRAVRPREHPGERQQTVRVGEH